MIMTTSDQPIDPDMAVAINQGIQFAMEFGDLRGFVFMRTHGVPDDIAINALLEREQRSES